MEFDNKRNMTVIETDGTIHTFTIKQDMFCGMVYWEANEENGEYQVKWIGDQTMDLEDQYKLFQSKVLDTVLTKTMDGTKLKDKGNIAIREDKDGKVCFCIDGEIVSPDNLAAGLSHVVGFNMQYQILDPAKGTLSEQEYLMPVRITKASLLEDFKECIELFADEKKFLSKDRVKMFDHAINPIIEKLRFLHDAGVRDDSDEAGYEMIDLLRTMESDDEDFPFAQASRIQKVVESYL